MPYINMYPLKVDASIVWLCVLVPSGVWMWRVGSSTAWTHFCSTNFSVELATCMYHKWMCCKMCILYTQHLNLNMSTHMLHNTSIPWIHPCIGNEVWYLALLHQHRLSLTCSVNAVYV